MKRRTFLLAALAALPALAQELPLGRLFTTPAERQRLDSLRAGGGTPAAPAGPSAPMPTPEAQPAAPAPPPPPPAPLTVNGIVRRADGRDTVWINNEPQQGQNIAPAGARKQPGVRVTLQNGSTVILQPGQQVDPVTGAVRNADQ
jgi:hypothetical protein